MLRGLLRCGCCGTSMGITFANRGERRYRYYLCHTANKHGYDACPVKTVPAGDIEQAVMLQLRRLFKSPEVLAGTVRAVQSREVEEVAGLNAAKAEAEKELAVVKSSAGHLVQAGSTGVSFVGEELTRLDAQRADLERRLQNLEAQLRFYATNPPTPETVAQELARLDNIWESLVPGEQERIVQLMVEQVVVHPDRLEVAFRVDGLHSIVTEMRPEEDADAK
jgi:site-specific DNA recombinase